jgi:hypothetical protein
MFNWMKPKHPLAPFSPGNPGKGTWYRTGFANGERTWSEEGNTLLLLASTLEAQGLKLKRGKEHLELDNELVLRPQFVVLYPQENGSVQTTTTIEVNHPRLCPSGAFEYQHSIDKTIESSVQKGFVGWINTDLPVFIAAAQEKFETCNTLQFEFPAETATTTKRRQVVLGPPMHLGARNTAGADDEHSFCPCCLFTNSLDAFHDHLQGNEFCGIRLYAARDKDGIAQADCRVNGLDWAPGAAALLKYIATWPDRGLEYRKQFVAIRTLP